MKQLKYLLCLIPLSILLLIFSLSSQDATTSNQLSKEVTKHIQPLAEKHLPPSSTTLTNSIVRDLAHVGLFFLLGIGYMVVLYIFLKKISYAALITFPLGLISAFVDECIQLGSPGRAFQLVDIGKDMIGITLAIGLTSVFLYVYKLLTQKLHHALQKA